jgi:4-hydroxysphinganine ceramide fatty acyl 2-hydroxylase
MGFRMKTSYAIYGLSHFTIHYYRFHYVTARNWAAHHHSHHYHADTNCGVATPLWDIVLGTRFRRASRGE